MQRKIEDSRVIWLNDENQSVGYIRYQLVQDIDTLICEKVFVEPELRGRALGAKMLKEFIAIAQEHHQKIYPLCPFAEKYFNQHPELNDLNQQIQLTESEIAHWITRKDDEDGSK